MKAPARLGTGQSASAASLEEPVARAGKNVGAGNDKPKYNNGNANFTTRCSGDLEVAVRRDQGTVQTYKMHSGPQGQAWSPNASWALQIKLKYPRSLRDAFRFKYKRPFKNPDCGQCEVVCGGKVTSRLSVRLPARLRD